MARHIVNPVFATPSEIGHLMDDVLRCSGYEEWVFDDETCKLVLYQGPEVVYEHSYSSVKEFEGELYFQSENR